MAQSQQFDQRIRQLIREMHGLSGETRHELLNRLQQTHRQFRKQMQLIHRLQSRTATTDTQTTICAEPAIGSAC